MEKEIVIRISGSEIKQNTIYGGVQGENNSRKMHIYFDDEWEGYSKRITFFDVNMSNAVKVILSDTNTYIEKDENGAYIIPVPSEALKEGGSFTYIIDGYTDAGEKFRSVTGKLKIREAPDTTQAGDPESETPTIAQQLQTAIDGNSTAIEDLRTEVDTKLENYYTKNETYDKLELDDKFENTILYAAEQSQLAINTASSLVQGCEDEAKAYTDSKVQKAKECTDTKLENYYTKDETDSGDENTLKSANAYADDEINERSDKLKYYGDSEIEITPAEAFYYEIVEETATSETTAAATSEAAEAATVSATAISSNLLDPAKIDFNGCGLANDDGTITMSIQAEDYWAAGYMKLTEALEDVLIPGTTYYWGLSEWPANMSSYAMEIRFTNSDGNSDFIYAEIDVDFTIEEGATITEINFAVDNAGNSNDPIEGTFILQFSESPITEYEVHANYMSVSNGDNTDDPVDNTGDGDNTGDITYVEGKYAVITGIKEDTSVTDIVIPYEIEGVHVASVRLSNNLGMILTNSTIKSIVIPKTVTEIGEYAFAGYKGLTELILPDSIESVGAYAIASCDGLTSLRLSANMKAIGQNAFWGCDGKIDRIVIPYGVTNVEGGAFADCNYIKEIFVPNTIVSISTGDGTTTNRSSFDECGTSTEAGGAIIYCEQGSYAETYAKENGIKYKYTDSEPVIQERNLDDWSDLDGYNHINLELDDCIKLYKGKLLGYLSYFMILQVSWEDEKRTHQTVFYSDGWNKKTVIMSRCYGPDLGGIEDYWTEWDSVVTNSSVNEKLENVKDEFNSVLAETLTNTPEIYIKESVEAMNEITSMKNGDLCIILSGETTAQSIYRYYTHDINGIDITDTWVWMTDLSLFAPQSVLELKGEKKEVEHTETDSSGLTIVLVITGEKFTWDYSKGNSAKLTIGDIYNSPEFANLEISNVNSGSYGVLDVFIAKYENSGYVTEDGVIIDPGSVNCELTLPENSYAFPPDWDYLTPEEGQHWRYSFYYDGNKFDWNRSVRNDE